MLRKEPTRVGIVAVTRTQLAIQDKLGWVFREQTTEDFGIDAQVEIVDGENVRGRLLALQIKGGRSWFAEPASGGWWFRPKAGHVEYWTAHSLPVVVVLYHPETGRCHWQLVNSETLQKTGIRGWKLLVPEAHVLDETARAALRAAASNAPEALPVSGRGFSVSRRVVVFGSLAVLGSAAVATPLFLSRAGTVPTAAPTAAITYRVLPGSGKIDSVVFDPHGRTLAGSAADGSVQLWDTATWTATDLPSSSRWTLAYSPDSGSLAGGDNDNPAVVLWDTTSKRATPLPGQVGRVHSVAFGPNGKTLASGSPDDWVEVWDVATGNSVARFFAYVPVHSVTFNRNGTELVLGCDDGTLQLRVLPTGAKIAVSPGHTGPVESVAYSPDWVTLASGGDDHTVRLWNGTTGSPIAVLRGHTDTVVSVAFSPDGKTLASGSYDATIRLWDVATHTMVAVLRGHMSWVESVAFSPDGATLASGSYDTTIRLWKIL